MTRKPVYDATKDGNVFDWLLRATETYRKMRKVEINAAKEAAAELERLGNSDVDHQKW